jgi:hypothetical protein
MKVEIRIPSGDDLFIVLALKRDDLTQDNRSVSHESGDRISLH